MNSEKPHGRDCPSMCSVCLGADVRRVSIIDGVNVIDGQAVDAAQSTGYGRAERYGRGARRKK